MGLIPTRAVVLSLWEATLLGSNGSFTGTTYQISYLSDIYVTSHNSNKIIVMKSQRKQHEEIY